jgi:hypothetical protein
MSAPTQVAFATFLMVSNSVKWDIVNDSINLQERVIGNGVLFHVVPNLCLCRLRGRREVVTRVGLNLALGWDVEKACESLLPLPLPRTVYKDFVEVLSLMKVCPSLISKQALAH